MFPNKIPILYVSQTIENGISLLFLSRLFVTKFRFLFFFAEWFQTEFRRFMFCQNNLNSDKRLFVHLVSYVKK